MKKTLRVFRPAWPVAVGALAATAGAGGFDSENVALYAHLPLSQFSSTFAEGCWGYVSPSGREYAIIGVSRGTAFVEITDPANPVIVGVIVTPNRGRDMKVYQNYVFSGSDSGPLNLFDVSDIDSGVIDYVDTFNYGTHTMYINADSDTLYLAVGGPMLALDVSNPLNPQHVGTWPGETHEVQVVTYHEGPYAGREIGFISAGRERALKIVDVTDKSNIFLVGQAGYPNAAYAHQGWLSGDRRYFYLNDELDQINQTSIFDVSDIANPVFVRNYSVGLQSTDHNEYWRDGFVFESDYTSGLRVFDACDPVNPVQVGWFDTYPAGDSPGYDGAWANYPYFPSGTVIVSDRSNGLFVLDVSAAIGKGCPGECPEDLDSSGDVGFADLLQLLAAWGPCGGPCPEDLDGSGDVGFSDLLQLLTAWGPCT